MEKYKALTYRDFRLFWFGNGISNIGTWMQTAAVLWQVYSLSHSKLLLGIVGLVRFVPIVIFSLLGGATADSRNRKHIQYISQLLLLLTSTALSFATVRGIITIPFIYLMTFIATVVSVFDGPARQAMVPSLVKKEDLGNAMSLNFIMFQTAQALGLALAGIVLAWKGAGMVYLINAISFIAVIISLYFMRYKGEIIGEPSEISWHAVREGLSFVRHKTIIWSTMILDYFSTFFASATTLFPVFATDVLHLDPIGYGLLSSAISVGALVGGIAMAQIGKIRHEGKVLLSAVVVFAIGTIGFGLSKNFALSFLALMLIGVGDSVSTIIRNTIRNLVTPDHIRGRMTSVNMLFFMGGPQLGEFEAGALAAAVGGPLSVVLGGVATLFVVTFVTYAIPVLRNYEQNI